MVDVKTAVRNAIEFAKESLGPERTADTRLEEIESSNTEGAPTWLITLSNAPVDERPRASLRALTSVLGTSVLGADTGREYKVFAVAKESGEVLSMKIRLLATVAK